MSSNSTNESNFNSTHNATTGYDDYSYIRFTVAAAVAMGLCLTGIVGNLIVFWYLLFRIQRNKYTVYIINLAAADCICLLFSLIVFMLIINTMVGIDPDFKGKSQFYLFVEIFYDGSLYSGMYFLTAISMERCLSVLFPLWYQCHRPKNLSVIMVSCLWILGCLQSLIENLICSPEAFLTQGKVCTGVEIMTFVLCICICLPLMILSSLTLLIKIERVFRRTYPYKLYIVIITAVLVFILVAITCILFWFLIYFKLLPTNFEVISFHFVSIYCTSFNCTVNPYIYFIVGRRWKKKSNNSIHETFQRAFKVEEEEQNKENSDKTSSTTCLNYIAQTENIS